MTLIKEMNALYDVAWYLSLNSVNISSAASSVMGIQSLPQAEAGMGMSEPSVAIENGPSSPQPGPGTITSTSSGDIANPEKIEGSSKKLGSGSGAGMVFPFVKQSWVQA